MTEQLSPPANWYADPEGSGRWRYWDGSAWTGVYLNQDEPGPSVWKQYWELARPWIFAVGVVGFAVSLAHGDLFPWLIVVILAGPRGEDSRRRPWYTVAFLGAIVIGIGVHSGWLWGLGILGCASAALAVGHCRERLPRWFVWTVTAFAVSGFGVLWLASSDAWRG